MANLIYWKSWTIVLILLCNYVFARESSPRQSDKNPVGKDQDMFHVNMLHKIAEEKIMLDTVLAFRCAKEGLAISNKINYSFGKAVSFFLLGRLYGCQSHDLDKGISYFKRSIGIAIDIDSLNLLAKNYFYLGKVFNKLELYSIALEYFLQSQFIYKKIGDAFHSAITLAHLGANYEKWGKDSYKLSMLCYDSALREAEKQKSKFLYAYTMTSLSSMLIHQGEYALAETYIRKALSITEKDSTLIIFNPELYCNRGEIGLEQKKPEEAIGYFNTALKAWKKGNSEDGRIQILFHIARWHHLAGNYAEAEKHYADLLPQAMQLKLKKVIVESYNGLAEIATHDNEYKKAVELKSNQMAYVDSIRKEQMHHLMIEIDSKLKVPDKKSSPSDQAGSKSLSVLQIMLIIGLLSVLVLAALFNMNKRLQKIVRDKAALSSEKSMLKNKAITLERELKNKKVENEELEKQMEFNAKTIMTNTLNIIQKNETLEKIKAKAEEIKKASSLELPAKINNLINTVNYALNIDKDWENFKIHFEHVHNNFFDSLKAKYPGLNSYDLKLCALIKLNLDTKEIATIMDISPESVKVARSRLRKKLQLDPSDNLSSFITQI